MRILCDLTDGGFTCADLDTGNSAFAYWSSTHYRMAKRGGAAIVAHKMLKAENAFRATLPEFMWGDGWKLTDQRRIANMRASATARETEV